MPLDSEYGKMSKRLMDKVDRLAGMLRKFTASEPVNIFYMTYETLGYPDSITRKLRKDREPKNASQIRTIVKWMRLNGYPVASSSKGYWMARSLEELQPTIDEFLLLAKNKTIIAHSLENCFDESDQTELEFPCQIV